MPISVAYILGAVFAVCATVCAMILIVPENKRATLPKFLQVVADIFNFKQLLLEQILKVLYILSTLFTVFAGFFMLFSGVDLRYYGGGFSSFAGYGLLTMIVGPIAIRLAYEVLMMFILLVKNTIEINQKMPKPKEEPAPEKPAEEWVFCQYCGTRYDKNQGGCPRGCGK